MAEDEISTVEAFEKALADDTGRFYRLRLFVSGKTARSTRAIASIKSICEEHLAGRYELSVIDLYQHPELAGENQVLAAPTLIKEMPHPLRKIIGDLSNEDKVLINLDIRPEEES